MLRVKLQSTVFLTILHALRRLHAMLATEDCDGGTIDTRHGRPSSGHVSGLYQPPSGTV